MIELKYKGGKWRRTEKGKKGQQASKEEIKAFLGKTEKKEPELEFKGGAWRKKGRFASKKEVEKAGFIFKHPKKEAKKKPRKEPKVRRKPKPKEFLYTYYFRCKIDSPPYEVQHYVSFYGVNDINEALKIHNELYPRHINIEINLAHIQHMSSFKKYEEVEI